MSFRMFANGTGGFHYEQDNNIEGSDFKLLTLISNLQGMTPDAGGVLGALADTLMPSIGADDAANVLATQVFLEQLNNSVDALAMCSGAGDGWISVGTRLRNALWSDTVRFASYNFSPGDSPGSEFIKVIGNTLQDTDMANWGVLRAMVVVLNMYSNQIDDSATPMLMMQLNK